MFTGIIECMGELISAVPDQDNLVMTWKSSISSGLKVDQSVSHNGVCLTVVQVQGETHTVVAIAETLRLTNLGKLKPGHLANLERAARIGDRLDGHMVQGHVDAMGECISVTAQNGSWIIRIKHPEAYSSLLVPKGSIGINGVSLTVVDCPPGEFSVAIIPYTWEHTNLSALQPGTTVNLEFDVVGKYVNRMMQLKVI